MKARIYHNPRCSKSRATLELLERHGVEVEVIEYLQTPPSAEELRQLLEALSVPARALLRTKEAAYSDAGLDRADIGETELIEAMVRTPILMERPIVVVNDKAVIGRPPENVLEII